MPIINITKEMLDAGKPWGRGWHPATIVDYKCDKSSKGDSYNHKPIYEYGWTSSGTRQEGKRLPEFAHLMNDKNMGMFASAFLPFVSAVLDIPAGQIDLGAFDTDKAKGTEVYIEIEEDTYNGNIQEKVKGIASKSATPF